MKTVLIEHLKGTDREVKGIGFTSIRPILAKDGMGFSIHKTIIPKGGPYRWHYKHHLEACYCIAGIGILRNELTGIYYDIKPDTVYVLDDHAPHTFQAIEDVVLISVFNPPVTGVEVHNNDGSYDIVNDSIGG